MGCGTENIFMEPVDVYVGRNQKQVQKVTCVPDTALVPLSGKYFLLYTEAGVKYCVHFGTAPTLVGYTMVEVTFVALDSAASIAAAVQTAIDALTPFTATVSGKVVTINNVNDGYASAAHDAELAIKKTLFAFDLVLVGDLMEKVGLLDGDVEVSGLSSEYMEVTAHQTGATTIGQIATSGGKPELSFTLKEAIYSRIAKLKRYTTGEYIPVASNSTPVVGGGLVGQFKPAIQTRVVFHPVSKDFADHSSDWAFWNAIIDMDTKTFSGENISVIPVTCKVSIDCAKPKAVQLYVNGDWTQLEAV